MIQAAALSLAKHLVDNFEAREKKLHERLALLERENERLRSKPTTTSLPLSSVLSNNQSERRVQQKQQQQLDARIDRVTRQRQVRERNVVIVGVSFSDNESDIVIANSFFTQAGVSTAVIRSVHRLSSSKKRNLPSNSNMLLVTLDAGRQEVLDKCRRHGLKGKYELVFAREDRTPSEQAEFNTMRAEMKRKNDELHRAGLLDNPCRYVIHKRERRPVCIDVRESSLQKRYVFERPPTIQRGRENSGREVNGGSRNTRDRDDNGGQERRHGIGELDDLEDNDSLSDPNDLTERLLRLGDPLSPVQTNSRSETSST
jgi:hypothetical protein